jgi:hypothetical protein
MKSAEVLLDSNIPMYAAGKDHEYKPACIRVLKAVVAGELEAVTDAEVFQEILHRFLAVNQPAQGFKIFDNFYNLMKDATLPVTLEDVAKAKELAGKYPASKARDLLHLAVMIRNNIKSIVTVDSHFDQFEEITRLNPVKFNLS